MNIRDEIMIFKPYDEQEEKEKELIIKYIDSFDNIFTRDNEFAHLTASCWIVNKEKTKVLMIFHNIYKAWSWVGGHADGEKDLLQVALRETTEETGVINIKPLLNDIFSLEIIGVDGHVKRGKYVGTHLHLNVTYLLEADENEKLVIKPDENSGVRWVSLTDAVKLCTEPYMKKIYDKLNKKLYTTCESMTVS